MKKLIKLLRALVVIAIVFVAVFIFTDYTKSGKKFDEYILSLREGIVLSDSEKETESLGNTEKKADEKESQSVSDFSVNEDEGYNFNLLSQKDRETYKTILSSLRENGKVEGLIVRDYEHTLSIYNDVVKDHPELFAYRSGNRYTYTSFMNLFYKIDITPKTNYTGQKLEKMQKELDEAADKIVKKAKKKKTAFEKILFVHDYIIKTTDYDKKKEPDELSHTAYGCLVKKKAVCDGYTYAFTLIMNRLNIPSSDVYGGEHAWNFVLLDGKYYYLDLTWDDPISQGEGGTLVHHYFMITTKELKKTHKIESENPPKCTSTKYDYYKRNGLYIESYNKNSFDMLLSQRLKDGEIELKFSSQAEAKKAKQELFENKEIWRLPSVRGRYSSVSWSTDNSAFLHIEFT